MCYKTYSSDLKLRFSSVTWQVVAENYGSLWPLSKFTRLFLFDKVFGSWRQPSFPSSTESISSLQSPLYFLAYVPDLWLGSKNIQLVNQKLQLRILLDQEDAIYTLP